MERPKTITVDGVTYRRVDEPSDHVLVRCDRAGVFLVRHITERSEDGRAGVLHDVRRVWYWDGAASLSELAVRGPGKPETCKIPVAVEEIEVTDIIEILPVTEAALSQFDLVPEWTTR